LGLLARLAERDTSGKQYVAEEVAALLRLAPVTARARVAFAQTLHQRFPDTLKQLEAATITAMHARALLEECQLIADDDTARLIEAAVLPKAAGSTLGQFRRAARRARLRLDSTSEQQRHRAARERRRISIRALDAGMAELLAYLPLDQAAAAQV